MNILILGGAGFLGSNLVRRCLKYPGNRVVVVDSLHPQFKSSTENLKAVWSKIRFIKGDIRNNRLMSQVVKNQVVIFNCAAQTSHPYSLANPLFDTEINCLGNLTILEAVRRHNPKSRLIYTSSSTAVGRSGDDVIDETHAERPLDIYSANKGVVEKYYRIYYRMYDIPTLSLRFANLYGPYGKADPNFGFINYFISLARVGKTIPIYGDGNQERNIMYVEDATELLYRCSKKPRLFGNVFFAVHREHYSVIKIAREIIKVFGKGKIRRIKWPEFRQRVEIGSTKISAARLFYENSFEPKFTLTEGLKKTKDILEGQKS